MQHKAHCLTETIYPHFKEKSKRLITLYFFAFTSNKLCYFVHLFCLTSCCVRVIPRKYAPWKQNMVRVKKKKAELNGILVIKQCLLRKILREKKFK